ncbi:MAG: hypothetical protein AAFV88_12155, partial [Planctomycetota bacterium]
GNNLGNIDIDFFDSDVIDINESHNISRVDLDESDRQFVYTASVGIIQLADDSIRTGSSNVDLIASSGTITDGSFGATASVTSSGTLTLIAQGNIGDTGTNPLDTAVTQIAASSSAGSITLRDAGDLQIGSGSSGVNGLTAAGDISIETSAGTLTIDQAVAPTTGSVTLQSASVDVNASVTGVSVDATASSSVDIASGVQVTATNGNLTLNADTILVGAGTSSLGSLQNQSANTISLSATTSLSLSEFSVLGGTGMVSVIAPVINVLQANGNAEVTSNGDLQVTSASIGSETNRLELSGITDLTLTDSGSGNLFLGEVNAATIAGVTVNVGGNGFGQIDLDYSNTDSLSIGDNHELVQVNHSAGNRSFSYSATSGNVSVGAIDVGSADVFVSADDGRIDRSVTAIGDNFSANLLTLRAADGIGSSATGAIQTRVGSLAAETFRNGSLTIQEADSLTLGVGQSGVVGLVTTGNQSISLSVGGDLSIDQAISAVGGDVTVSSGNVTANAGVSGANLQVFSSGNVQVTDGNRLVAGGTGTTLFIEALSIELGSGAFGSESVTNSGSGDIWLATSSGDVTVGEHGIGAATGGVTIDANENAIIASQPTANSEINIAGELTLTAGIVGSFTNELEISGATVLNIQTNGQGDVFLAELTGNTIAETNLTVGSIGPGLILIDFQNSDTIEVSSNHTLDHVDLSGRNGSFSYTALSGSIVADLVETGSGSISLSSSNGSIIESVSDSDADLITSGALSLFALDAIGSSVEALEIEVQTLTVNAAGGIYLSDASDVVVGSHPNGQSGLNTSGGDLILSVAGTLQVDQGVNTNGGFLQLSASTLDLNTDVLGGSVTLQTTNALTIDAGTRVIAGGDGTILTVNASSVTLNAGSSSAETLSNSGTGAITVNSTGNIVVADDSIATGTGDITLNSSNGVINELASNANASVRSSGQLNLISAGSIGASSGGGFNALFDVAVQSVTATVTGTGGVHLADADSLVVNGIATSNGEVEVNATDALTVQNAVSTGASGDITFSAATIALDSGGDLSTPNGTISLNASLAGGLALKDDAVLSTGSGQVSGQLFNAANPFSASSSVGSPLSDSNRIATINVALADSFGTNILVEVDWAEGDQINPVPLVPPENLRAQVVQTDVAIASVGNDISHEYEDAPDPTNPSADINIGLRVEEIANGTISLFAGGNSLLNTSQFSAQVITIEVSAAIFPLFFTIPDDGSIETVITRVASAAAERDSQRIFVNEASQELNNSIGTTDNSHQRYYVLRIVSFGEEGEVKLTQEDQEYRLRNMEDADSETGFELSQLPELFKKLPDDRYRIYLVEGQTERLVLDFIIRDGQPIEAQSDDVTEVIAPDFESEEFGEAARDEEAPIAGEPTKQPSAMERLGRTPVLSTGGVILTAGMVTQNRARREKDHDESATKTNQGRVVTWR